jgi:hypothetical protein
MKSYISAVAAAIISTGLLAIPALAQERGDPPIPPQATKKYSAQEKAEARAKRKADIAEARKNGTMPAVGDKTPDAPVAKRTGTKESRSAERKAVRKAAADDRKANPPKAESNN